MIKIGISAELEREIRSGRIAGPALRDEVVKLLDKERAKMERKVPGLGYREIVDTCRSVLGPRLAVPPTPSTGWIIRQVARSRELGLNVEQLKKICTQAGRLYHGPIELEFILRAAARFVSGGDGGHNTEGAGVFTGRSDE